MISELQKTQEELTAACHSLFERGLVNGAAGNMSVKVAEGYVATPTGIPFGALHPENLSLLSPEGICLSGPPPTKEMGFHLAWYAANPAHRAVIHTHSPWAVAVSCLEELNPDNVLPPLTPYQIMKIGFMPLAPYGNPGSKDLEEAVAALAPGRAAVLLANHGPVAGATSFARALDVIEEIEATCRLWLTLADKNMRLLTPQQVEKLMEKYRQ